MYKPGHDNTLFIFLKTDYFMRFFPLFCHWAELHQKINLAKMEITSTHKCALSDKKQDLLFGNYFDFQPHSANAVEHM